MGEGKILVMTSSFKRFRGDGDPDFVFNLVEYLSKKFDHIVLAPSFFGAEERSLGVIYPVVLFRYCIRFCENLAYDGGIPSKLQKNRAYAILVPFFVLSQFLYGFFLVLTRPISIIHAHWVIPQGVVAVSVSKIIAILTKKQTKVVITIHGSDFYRMNNGIIRALKLYVLSQADVVTVVSSHMKSEILNTIRLKNLVVAPMGVDMSQFNSPIACRQETEIIFVGRLVKQKGISYLIDAVSALKSRYPSITLRVYGGGPEEVNLRAQANKLGMGRSILFEGFQSSEIISKAFKQAALCVVPSIGEEGLGLVPIEAMASGCPVIASRYGAISDIIVDRVSGRLVIPESSLELKVTIDELLGDEGFRQLLSENGRLAVREKYSWDTCAGRYENIYDQLLTYTEE